MITVTKLNGSMIIVNADLVEFIEETPDCLISLTTGRKLMVRETVAAVMTLLAEYKKTTRGAYAVPCGGKESQMTEYREAPHVGEKVE